jgi:hypothetical protein
MVDVIDADASGAVGGESLRVVQTALNELPLM